jgi:iron complex transport system substrate-binding protein
MRYLTALLLCLCSLHSTASPPRVIALSWEATEYLLTLGVTPVAIADRDDYRRWVSAMPLPPQVLDAGSRLEPSLERLHALKPALIVINPALAGMQANLQRIAPTLLLDAYREDHDNRAAAERLQRQLAVRLGRLAAHQAFLQQHAQQTRQLRRQLAARFGNALPPLCIVRFASVNSFWAYGANSQAEAALQALGLANACPQARSAWGTRLRKLPELLTLDTGWLVHIAPFAQQAELERSVLWQALPLVQQRRVIALPPAWTNGGLASQARLEVLLTRALLQDTAVKLAARPAASVP